MKFRTDRPGLSIEPIWTFYPRYWFESAVKLVRWATLSLRLRGLYLGIRSAMPRKSQPEVLRKLPYSDLAMTPVSEHEAETHELFGTAAAKAYLDHERRLRDARRATMQRVVANPK